MLQLCIPRELKDFICSTNSQNSLKAVCCDGTNDTVVHDGGIIRILELSSGQSLKRVICCLHLNVFHSNIYLKYYFGKTMDPHLSQMN